MTMNGNIILFEDHLADQMRPVSLTRPTFAVTCACYNLYDVAAMSGAGIAYIVRDHLVKTAARSFPKAPAQPGEPTLLLNAAVAPDVRYADDLRELLEAGEPFLCTAGQRVAAALLPGDAELPADLSPEGVSPYLLGMGLPLRAEEEFMTLDYPFDIIRLNEDLFPANLERRIADGGFEEIRPGVCAGKGVNVADTVAFHAEEGPIVLEEGVRVMDLAYLQGPLYVGPNSRLIERSSVKEFTCIGHTCKIGGEVEAAVVEPYTNKQHHGFLGHAYVGSWVNLGAGTSNSDLKNTYGEVRIEHMGRRVDTGMQFLGCIIGDYAKSAINTSIFTGKIIGVASMLYGYVGRNAPSFCNYAASFGQLTEYTLDQAIITQKRMFARRNVEQTEDDIALLTAVYELTGDERRFAADPPAF
jgi:glucose-1-phosphate thymidylyltransferase